MEESNANVTKVRPDPTSTLPKTLCGRQGSGPGELSSPSHVAVSPVSGNIVVTDRCNNRVQLFTSNGQFVSMFGSCGSTDGQFKWPRGVAVTRQGDIAVCDTNNHRVQLFTERGEHLRSIGCKASQPGCFNRPAGICCHRDQLYVCDLDNHRVQVLALDGTFIREIRTGNRWPWDVAVCAGGELVVVCGGQFIGELLCVYSAGGEHKSTFGGGEPGSVRLCHPQGVTVTSDGHIIVTDTGTNMVHVLEQNGKLIHTFGSSGDEPGQQLYPVGVVCTQDGGIAVVDTSNDRIQLFGIK